ncbi:hypothetical protein B2A_10975, partial [mine drainage metagenome]
VPYYWLQKAESVPPIHDITTDPAHPPAFTALLPHLAHIPNTPVYGGGNARARQIERESVIGFATRGEGRRNPEAALVVKNCKTWSPRCLATVQSVYYPDIRPLIFKGRNPTQVYAAALAIMHRRGWTVAFASPGTGRIEAVARTAWFGFKDDVALRIEAALQALASICVPNRGSACPTLVETRSGSIGFCMHSSPISMNEEPGCITRRRG